MLYAALYRYDFVHKPYLCNIIVLMTEYPITTYNFQLTLPLAPTQRALSLLFFQVFKKKKKKDKPYYFSNTIKTSKKKPTKKPTSQLQDFILMHKEWWSH